LKGFYDSNGTDWKVVVLDFDLSWHRGAVERSVLHSTVMGYLAPEQIQFRPQMSTRSAAVDSYGFGMTLYFMCTGKDPIAEQHRHRDWNQMLVQGVVNRRCPKWRSLPKRVARLIDMSTKDDQARRLDMGQIEAELDRLGNALGELENIQSLEIIAEEIASRAESLSAYRWNADRGSAQYATQSGLKVEISGHETTKTVDVRLDWETTGTEDRKRLGDLINSSKDRAAQKLQAGGWQIYRKETNVGGFRIAASADKGDIVKNIDKLASAVDGAIQQVRTD
jgi:eukaryotic-like serine/threonine-protein kinase